jgi:hypothetical protein
MKTRDRSRNRCLTIPDEGIGATRLLPEAGTKGNGHRRFRRALPATLRALHRSVCAGVDRYSPRRTPCIRSFRAGAGRGSTPRNPFIFIGIDSAVISFLHLLLSRLCLNICDPLHSVHELTPLYLEFSIFLISSAAVRPLDKCQTAGQFGNR